MGKVSKIFREYFEIESKAALNNNDGLFFLSKKGESCGIKINQVIGKQIFPDKMNGIYQGATVYRNYNHEFRKKIDSEKSLRKIRIEINLKETEKGFEISVIDESQIKVTEEFIVNKEAANDILRSEANIIKQLSKSGDTAFEVENIKIHGCQNYFFPVTILNQMRREVLEKLAFMRKQKPSFSERIQPNSIPFPPGELKYQTNVSNDLALKFYQRHGVVNPEMAFEKQSKEESFPLMTTKHCLKYQLGYCRRYNGSQTGVVNEPLYIINETGKYKLQFDCQTCHMKILMC
jgi:putative protease